MQTVLVTGGSGFVARHCILALLKRGYAVRATLRNMKREPEIRDLFNSLGNDFQTRLSFYAADLEKEEGWDHAVKGCDYVLHVASPFPSSAPQSADDLVVPAREGTLRILRAASQERVKRVVITSSFAAVGYGHPTQEKPFDETSWTNVDGADVAPYIKSKTLAEKAAWGFIESDKNGLELAVVNPVGIFGPILGADFSSSVLIIKSLLEGKIPFCPRVYFGCVDVRDVADIHLLAMTRPEAKGERFLAVAGPAISLHDVAKVLRQHLGQVAQKVPRFQIPDWVLRISALFNSESREVIPQLGKVRNSSSGKAQKLLGWKPRSNEESLLATAESLISHDLLGH